jgi:deoxyribodipyrimidine photo-lyase
MASAQALTIVWFRRDLRLADNPALTDAVARGSVLPVYIDDYDSENPWSASAAYRWWTHYSLDSLQKSLAAMGSRLIIRKGTALKVLKSLITETGANAVVWNRGYEPAGIVRDTAIKEALRSQGVEAISHKGALLLEPHEVANKQGTPYLVYTPFWRGCYSGLEVPAPLPAPSRMSGPSGWPKGIVVVSLKMLPKIPWDSTMRTEWVPGESAGQTRLSHFSEGPVLDYSSQRDIPSVDGTSALSPYLAHGEMSPRQVWHAVLVAQGKWASGARPEGVEVYFKEIVWREFAYHLLYHFPQTTDKPLKEAYARFPWRSDPLQLKAWQHGRTGYPLVDAGMRQLWATGWMHNRVRMVVGSFLVKHLLLPWQDGARWFFDTLIDADLASNSMGWQWTAGSGADAAPYFRIFHPVTQGERFDPEGTYIRKWVPELKNLAAPHVHRPWEAPSHILSRAGVAIGTDYPKPIVDHDMARKRALAALASLKE